MKRIQRLLPLLEAERIGALLVTDIYNIRYLLDRPTLFDEGFNGALFVSTTGATLLADYRYSGLADDSLADSPIEARRYKESLLQEAARLAAESHVDRMGYEAVHISAEAAQKLLQALPGSVATSRMVEGLRAVKDEGEVERVRAAAALADSVFQELLDMVRPGVAESDVALELEILLRKRGAQAVSFQPIIAAGPNSAFPHATSTGRVMARGDLVKLDYGCRLDGYCSDMTRMAVIGPASDSQVAMYTAVRKAQQLAIEGLRVGMSGIDADGIARVYLKESGSEGEFGHGLGHGVGMQVHEKPSLAPRSRDELSAGMVFTVEPGLYVPGFGGIRIEDMVVLRQNGPEVITTAPRDLVEIR